MHCFVKQSMRKCVLAHLKISNEKAEIQVKTQSSNKVKTTVLYSSGNVKKYTCEVSLSRQVGTNRKNII